MNRGEFTLIDKRNFSKLPDYYLAQNLLLSEFQCQCNYRDCTYTIVNDRLLQAWVIVRHNWSDVLFINSGFRCQRHNLDVGGVRDSWHKRGCAIDIRPRSIEDLLDLYKLASKFFDLVILYEKEGFIHCQMEEH